MTTPRVLLLPKRARPFYGRHPWVYAGAVASVEGNPADGEEVDVHSHGGSFIARGLYNSRSRIRVRLYAWEPERPLDAAFFRERIETALRLRRRILRLPEETNAYRLVYSEGDGLSGMIVDQYDRWLVLQFTSLGMANRKELFVRMLNDMVQPEGIYLRTERGIGKLEGLELQDGPLSGNMPVEPAIVWERAGEGVLGRAGEKDRVEFSVDVAEGQKTGFYLDQRTNRRAAARYVAGRRVLDAFCYTGGFGIHAGCAGAGEIVGVDVSESALELARRNAARNGVANATFLQFDVFDYMETAAREGQKFDLIVLDPPKFARAQHAVEDALRGYRRLQTLALLLLNSDGILVTCCCSGLIEMHMIESLAAQVAAEARRTVQILERRGQAADHPVAVSCLESSYLKCLITRIA